MKNDGTGKNRVREERKKRRDKGKHSKEKKNKNKMPQNHEIHKRAKDLLSSMCVYAER